MIRVYSSDVIFIKRHYNMFEYWMPFSLVSDTREIIPPEICIKSVATGVEMIFDNTGRYWQYRWIQSDGLDIVKFQDSHMITFEANNLTDTKWHGQTHKIFLALDH